MFLAALVGLILAQAQLPYYSNQQSHSIPLEFEKAKRNEIRQILLFVSGDQGKTWQQQHVQAPDKENIVFAARTDGEYWLQLATVTHQGKQEPDNIPGSPPQQKIVIDTIQPLVRITSAQRQGEEIVVAWEIQEKNPDWDSFKMEYQLGATSVWTPVPVVNAQATGQTQFRPGTQGPVNLRLLFRDRANNATLATFQVGGSGPGLTPPAAPFQLTQAGGSGNLAPPPAFPVANKTAPQAELSAPPPGLPKSPTPSPGPQGLPPTMDAFKNPQKTFPPPPHSVQATSAWEPGAPGQVPVASSEVPLQPAQAKPSAPPPPPKRNLPPLQYVNQPEVVIEYELTRVGPSGVGKVDLWWTQDEGMSWEKYAYDEEVKSAGKHQRTIELPGDGVYGFAIVVKSRAGLGRKEPKPGDVPEIRVQVDTIAPVAHLFAPVADRQRGNTLVLSWNARDNNLHSHPINLEWAEQRDGPWHAIAANLANSGKHAWQLPPSIPVQVYLRLRVNDWAGNESMAVTPEPLLVDLTEPEGRLLNVSIPNRR